MDFKAGAARHFHMKRNLELSTLVLMAILSLFLGERAVQIISKPLAMTQKTRLMGLSQLPLKMKIII